MYGLNGVPSLALPLADRPSVTAGANGECRCSPLVCDSAIAVLLEGVLAQVALPFGVGAGVGGVLVTQPAAAGAVAAGAVQLVHLGVAGPSRLSHRPHPPARVRPC